MAVVATEKAQAKQEKAELGLLSEVDDAVTFFYSPRNALYFLRKIQFLPCERIGDKIAVQAYARKGREFPRHRRLLPPPEDREAD